MGRSNKGRLRGYLEDLIKIMKTQQDKLVDVNDKNLELKLERTLLVDAYNFLALKARNRIEELTSKDEAMIWMEDNNFTPMSNSKEESLLIDLMMEYVDDVDEFGSSDTGEEEEHAVLLDSKGKPVTMVS